MEPKASARRPNRMFADTDAIRLLGAAHATHADDLAAIAAALAALPPRPDAFGEAGRPFAAALAAAVSDAARSVAALGDRLASSTEAAYRAAAAYRDADAGAGARIVEV